MQNAIRWFEIPVADIDRAQTFYETVLARVEAAGGRIVAPKSALPPGMGFIAHLRDTEGNEVGLHSLD